LSKCQRTWRAHVEADLCCPLVLNLASAWLKQWTRQMTVTVKVRCPLSAECPLHGSVTAGHWITLVTGCPAPSAGHTDHLAPLPRGARYGSIVDNDLARDTLTHSQHSLTSTNSYHITSSAVAVRIFRKLRLLSFFIFKLSSEAMTTYYFHSCTCVRACGRAAVRASRTCFSETAEDI
jgi:hypothetical protein